jgi:hypothetical protein
LLLRATGSFEKFYDLGNQGVDFPYLAFPHYEHTPAETSKRRDVSRIASHIPFPLRTPEFRICSGDDSTVTAFVHMPKTSVDEDDLVAGRENQIRPAWQILLMQNVAIAETMCCTANDQLRLCVFPCNGGHIGASLFWRQDVGHKVFR